MSELDEAALGIVIVTLVVPESEFLAEEPPPPTHRRQSRMREAAQTQGASLEP